MNIRESEETIKARLYKEFEEVEIPRIKREKPQEYHDIAHNAQEYEHVRWEYIKKRFTEEKYK